MVDYIERYKNNKGINGIGKDDVSDGTDYVERYKQRQKVKTLGEKLSIISSDYTNSKNEPKISGWNDSSIYNNRIKSYSNRRILSSQLSADMKVNKSIYVNALGEENYNEIISALDSTTDAYTSLMDALKEQRDWHSQFKTSEEFEYAKKQAEEQSRLDAMSAGEAEAKLQEISAQKAAFKQENGGRFINNLSKLGAYLGGFTGASQVGLQEAKNKSNQNLAALDELDAQEEKYRKTYQQKKSDEEIAKLDADTIALLDTINEGEAATDIYFAEKRANELTGAIAVNGDAYTYKTNARDAAIQKLEERGIDNWKELAEYRQYQKNAQEAERQTEEAQKLADEHPIAAFAAARAANFESGIGIIENIKALDNVTDLGADTNSPYYLLARATRDIDTRNMENHDAVVDVPIFGDVDLYDFGYNLASSTADNALRAVASGGNSAVAGALMGSQVFSQGFLDAKEKGYSDNKAFGMAFTQAAIEGATEKWSLDAILKSPKTFFGGIARGFAAEGSEEIASNWANRVTDAFVNGNNAEIKQAYNAYIRDGYSHNQALSAIIMDMVGEDLEAGLIGGLSGAGMSTVVHAPAAIRQAIEDKAVGQSLLAQGKVGDLAQNILSENENGESAFSADKSLQRLAKQGESLSSRKAGKMARLAASSTSETALTSTVAEMLSDAGMDENAAVSAAPAVLKSIRGEKLSIEQRALLKDSEAAQSVISSLKDAKSAQAVLAKAEEENLFLKAKLYAKPSMNTVSTADVQQAKAKIDGNTGVKSDKITSIVSSSADGVWYRTNSGEVVRGTAVEFENDGVAQMFSDLADLDNVNAANVALVGYSGQNVPMYTAAVQRVVRAASTGQSLNSLLSVNRQTVGVLGEQLTKAIYNAAGKTPAMVKNYTKADLDAVRKTGGVLKNYTQKLTAREDATVRVIDEIGKKYGVAVVVCDTIDGGQSNGFYNEAENAVYIGLDAHGGLYLSALGHELFHHLKAVNPESADELHDFVIDKLKKSEKYDYKAELKKRRKLYGADKSVRYLEEEMVADSIFSVFDSQTVEALVQEHRTLAEKIKDFLEDVLSWIEKTARNWSREAYALSEDEKTLSEIRDKFLSALEETAKTWADNGTNSDLHKGVEDDNRPKNNTDTENGGLRYSIEKFSDGKQYVKAERQVFSGNDPEEWGKQVTNYINKTIRDGKDVTVYAQDGDALTITENTAGKAAFRNDVRQKDGTKRPMTDEEYAVKLRAESHVDEISQVSRRGKKLYRIIKDIRLQKMDLIIVRHILWTMMEGIIV